MNNEIQSNLKRMAVSMALAGGFALLSGEIRFEHRSAIVDDWRPWIPIVYSLLMPALILIEVLSNKIASRRMLIGAYIITIGLGLVGVYFHADGKLVQRLDELVYVWISSVKNGAVIPARHAPLLAPLSFVGLGFLGLLTMCETKNSSRVIENADCFVNEDAHLIRNEAA